MGAWVAALGLLFDAVDSVRSFVDVFIYVYVLVIFVYVLTSWIPLPYSPWLNRVQRFLYDVCDPYLRLFRRVLRLALVLVVPVRQGRVDGRQGGSQQGADARRVGLQPLVVGGRLTDDRAGLGAGLLDDQVALAGRLRLQLGGRPLGRDERRPEQSLELAEALEVGLELLDLVGEVGTLAPDVLEACGDLLEQPVGRRAPVAEQASAE